MTLSEQEWNAVTLSVLVGSLGTLLSLPPALALAYALARWKSRGRWVVETLVNLPLVLPPVVTGFLLLLLFGRRGPVGAALESTFGWRIAFTWRGAVLAGAVLGFPLMVRAIRLAFQGVNPRLEAAARTLGAGRWRTFLSISLPLAWRGVLAGCVLSFARALGEFGATIMLAGNIEGETQTIPLAIYSLAQRPGGMEQSWGLVIVSIAIASGAIIVSEVPSNAAGNARLFSFHARHRYSTGFELDADFTADGQVTALFGPSGSGKTSIVEMIAGLRQPQSGRIALGERVLLDTDARIDCPMQQRGVGLVSQDQLLFPHLHVRANLRYGLRRTSRQPVDFDRVVEVLELGNLLGRWPQHLSGGERQRVALGRALVSGPELLLMDEPLAALDEPLKDRILTYLERALAEWRIPTLLVSHNPQEVRRLAEQVITLDQGKVIGVDKTGTFVSSESPKPRS